ncbi:hypothetical protein [Lacticaseibacillus sharpeae]|uniref:Uncharacterized protein n=1 Tax=Lacticaseibacillus sharpeae JCM 1186 = DSM 20505 TaxID=1291052 RepID=A0A0R1ZNV5_9LACO|nr:hypothetical protein [Lacticaseibacillus sharpeae]KRM56669.1 hypothetical protein FC18_GL001803 [Lacticaseibacillus sharpeae JCM 1186 = DSM 20505]
MKLSSLIYNHYNELKISSYFDGNTALILRDPEGDEEVISVNIPSAMHYPSDQTTFWADVNNCDQAIDALTALGVIRLGMASATSGFVT